VDSKEPVYFDPETDLCCGKHLMMHGRAYMLSKEPPRVKLYSLRASLNRSQKVSAIHGVCLMLL
jgi:hypothetical protein